MAIDIEAERRKQAKLKQKSKGSTWKPEEGEAGNIVRVLKFQHKVTKADVQAGYFTKEQIGKTLDLWDREVTRQFGFTENNAPIISTPESIAKFEKVKRIKGKEVAAKIRPSTAYAINIVDINAQGEKKVETWLCPKSVRTAIGDHLVDSDYGEEIFGVEGRDFKIAFDKEAAPALMYKVKIREEKLCKELDEDLEDKVTDLYGEGVLETFGVVADGELEMRNGSKEEKPAAGDEPDDEDEKEEPPVAKKKKPVDDDELL